LLAPGPIWPGARIGLYGGSFNPPHSGHAHVAANALARFGLDQVWALVSPQNPLKQESAAPYDARLRAARERLERPRIRVSDLEARIGARYTIETVRALRHRYPQARFVLVMGADSFATLHRWRDWRALAHLIPIGVVSRPGWTMRALTSPAARALHRVMPFSLAETGAPRWSYVGAPFNAESSTAIRAR
jgi:nicotinate-nucleotide adenylyltransferase